MRRLFHAGINHVLASTFCLLSILPVATAHETSLEEAKSIEESLGENRPYALGLQIRQAAASLHNEEELDASVLRFARDHISSPPLVSRLNFAEPHKKIFGQETTIELITLFDQLFLQENLNLTPYRILYLLGNFDLQSVVFSRPSFIAAKESLQNRIGFEPSMLHLNFLAIIVLYLELREVAKGADSENPLLPIVESVFPRAIERAVEREYLQRGVVHFDEKFFLTSLDFLIHAIQSATLAVGKEADPALDQLVGNLKSLNFRSLEQLRVRNQAELQDANDHLSDADLKRGWARSEVDHNNRSDTRLAVLSGVLAFIVSKVLLPKMGFSLPSTGLSLGVAIFAGVLVRVLGYWSSTSETSRKELESSTNTKRKKLEERDKIGKFVEQRSETIRERIQCEERTYLLFPNWTKVK